VGIHKVDVNGEYTYKYVLLVKKISTQKIRNNSLNETPARSFKTQIGALTSAVLTNYCKNQHTPHA